MLAHAGQASTCLGERLDLGVGEEPLLILGCVRQAHPVATFAGEPPVLGGHVEDEREHPVDLSGQ